MGKGKRMKAARRVMEQASSRHLMVVDGCDVGHLKGWLTVRTGYEDTLEAWAAIPGLAAPPLVDALGQAALDAEEDYWSVIREVVRVVGTAEPEVLETAIPAWLLDQDWGQVLRAVDRTPEHGVFVISHVGHVALVADPPWSPRPAVMVFNPLQLQRMADWWRACALQAHAAAPLAAPPSGLDAPTILGFLATQPWPPEYREPTAEEAAEEVRERYVAYLRRPPSLRSPENDLPLL